MRSIVYNKRHKIKISYVTNFFLSQIVFGFYGLKTLKAGVLKVTQLEVIRRILTRILKRGSKIYIRAFFIFPITKKPLLTRMGKGAGGIKAWVCMVKKGSILMEINSLSFDKVKQAFLLIVGKSSIPLVLIARNIALLH